MPRSPSPSLLIGVTVVTMAVVCLIHALGFGHGPVAGATPAAGIAFAAGVWLGVPGAVAAGLGFLLAGLVLRLPIEHVVVISLSHAAAAALAGAATRALSRRRTQRTHTSGQLVFVAGAGLFVAVVALVALAAAGLGFIAFDLPGRFVAVIVLFEPLGLITAFPVVAHTREWRDVVANPRPIVPIAALGIALTAALAYVLRATGVEVTAGATLVLSMPFCLWVAMQRRTLDGAAVALVASHVVLYLVLRDVGSVLHPAYLLTALYLILLILTAQFVHAVNLDRLDALAALAAERAELETRVAERTARLAEMSEQARAADAAKSRLIATLNHEARTPLNGVIGMASLVLAGPVDARTRANVEVIRRSGFHLLDVINRVIDYSQLGDGALESEIEDFDLRALAEEVIEEARSLPFAEGLEIVLEMAPGPERRRGQRQGLRRVLAHLIGNALKFTDEGRVRVRIGAPDPEGLTRIEVIDTGAGIPPEAREWIFRPFERGAGAAARRHGGVGLGLAISSEIVARMGGRIGLDSAPGAGSRFWIDLPLPFAEAPGAALSA